jgi:hypothetical protein
MREIATVSSVGLNLHTRADKNAPLVNQLRTGDEMLVITRKGTWLNVKVTKTKTGNGVGESGWVDSHYVTLRQEWDKPVEPPKAKVRPLDVLLAVGAAVFLLALGWALLR